jgi:peptidoglycan-associated lipoprotein
MRRALLLSLSVMAVALAGCPSKPKNGECKSSEDCKDQQGFGKVCVQGRCQECGADTDCQAGFVCRDNKCAPRPECQSDSDCGAGRACAGGHCVAAAPPPPECESDAQCGQGRGCEGGRCVTRQAAAEAGPSAVERCVGGEENHVHFAFDRSDLDAQARGILEKIANCLKQAHAQGVTIEGHCDEKGTTEYNLHLGERRAEAVKKYLVNLGLNVGSLRTTSYGKERPLCTESNESCWARNRRGVLHGGAGGTSSLGDRPERHAWR